MEDRINPHTGRCAGRLGGSQFRGRQGGSRGHPDYRSDADARSTHPDTRSDADARSTRIDPGCRTRNAAPQGQCQRVTQSAQRNMFASLQFTKPVLGAILAAISMMADRTVANGDGALLIVVPPFKVCVGRPSMVPVSDLRDRAARHSRRALVRPLAAAGRFRTMANLP